MAGNTQRDLEAVRQELKAAREALERAMAAAKDAIEHMDQLLRSLPPAGEGINDARADFPTREDRALADEMPRSDTASPRGQHQRSDADLPASLERLRSENGRGGRHESRPRSMPQNLGQPAFRMPPLDANA